MGIEFDLVPYNYITSVVKEYYSDFITDVINKEIQIFGELNENNIYYIKKILTYQLQGKIITDFYNTFAITHLESQKTNFFVTLIETFLEEIDYHYLVISFLYESVEREEKICE